MNWHSICTFSPFGKKLIIISVEAAPRDSFPNRFAILQRRRGAPLLADFPDRGFLRFAKKVHPAVAIE